MPRSSRTSELIFDPEVEKTAWRAQKETRQLREKQSSAVSQKLEPDSLGDTSGDSDQEKVSYG